MEQAVMEQTKTTTKSVIALDTFRPRSGRPPLAQIEAYWRTLAPSGALPRRRDVNPKGMENALPYAFVLEQVAPTVARFRVAGQTICSTAGFEVRGMPLTCLFALRSRQAVSSAVADVFQTPAMLELDLLAPRRFGRSIGGRLLLMPLFDDKGRVSRAIGGLVTDEPIDGNVQFATPNSPSRREVLMAEPDALQVNAALRPAQRSHQPDLRLVSCTD